MDKKKRRKKCEECMKKAKEEARLRRLSVQTYYNILRDRCTHINEG